MSKKKVSLLLSVFLVLFLSFYYFKLFPSIFSESSEDLYAIVEQQKNDYSVKVVSSGSATNIKDLSVRTKGKNAYIYVDMSSFPVMNPHGEKTILIKDVRNIKRIYLGSDKKLVWTKKEKK